MGVYGCLEIYGFLWVSISGYGRLWVSMSVWGYRCLWMAMEVYSCSGCLWKFMGVYRCFWVFMGWGYMGIWVWGYMGVYRWLWVFMGVYGCVDSLGVYRSMDLCLGGYIGMWICFRVSRSVYRWLWWAMYVYGCLWESMDVWSVSVGMFMEVYGYGSWVSMGVWVEVEIQKNDWSQKMILSIIFWSQY